MAEGGRRKISLRRHPWSRDLKGVKDKPCLDQGLEHSREREHQGSLEYDSSKLKTLFLIFKMKV